MISEKKSFDKNFEIFLADTEAGKKVNFQIRHQVFCEDMGFTDDLFPEQMEYDKWDQHADHFLVRDRYTGEWIAAMRLVHKNQTHQPYQEQLLPATEDATTKENQLDAVELSRLCVLKETRRIGLPNVKLKTLGDAELSNENQQITHIRDFRINKQIIMWGLYHAAAVYLKKNHISSIYTLLTAGLASQIKREGIDIQQIKTTEKQPASRLPYQLNIKNILANKSWSHDYKQGVRLYSAVIKENELRQQIN